tara:strand:+ start:7770 stop:9029 length:1260 start_codon:yes stop_codon:yes gene_type:complete
MDIHLNKNLFFIYLIILLIPIFFLLNGKIYYEPDINLNLQSYLYNVPIPASYFISTILICYFFYKKNFKIFDNKIIKILIYSIISLIILLIFNKSLDYYRAVNLIQFLLPWMGLIIALNLKIYENTYNVVYYFLLCILSLQLFLTFFLGKKIIISNILFFTVYQNIQYVSTIFTLLTILVSMNLYREKKIEIIFLNLISLIYSTLVYSLSSLIIFALFFLGYLIKVFFKKNKSKKKIFKTLTLAIIFFFLFSNYFTNLIKNDDETKFMTNENNVNYYENMLKFKDILNFKSPANINLRIEIYKKYYEEILDNKKILLIGDKEGYLDKIFKSSHNLILDIIYKFGLILVIPYLYLFFLIFFRLISLNKKSNDFYSLLFVLVVIVIENFFKVSLKQPYPGIISFYLIGYYLKKTSYIKKNG